MSNKSKKRERYYDIAMKSLADDYDDVVRMDVDDGFRAIDVLRRLFDDKEEARVALEEVIEMLNAVYDVCNDIETGAGKETDELARRRSNNPQAPSRGPAPV
jgi:hypothetical protein